MELRVDGGQVELQATVGRFRGRPRSGGHAARHSLLRLTTTPRRSAPGSRGDVSALEVTSDGAVLRLTINRPERKNSLPQDAVRELVEALEAAATDDALRVVLLSGRGDDFCSGADWVATNAGDEKPRTGSIQRRTPVQAHRLIALLMEVQLPVVCRVEGGPPDSGCQLALASDFAIAADDSRFWLPFVKRGFTADSGSTWLLPRLVGVARAKEMLLLGRPVSGADAAAWG